MQWSDRIGRRLKPRDLHVFMAVAEHGNMAKAANRLAISRPVVSKTISQLEHTLGVPLFDRSPQGIEPTLYGRALQKRGVAIFDELRKSVKEIEFLVDPTSGELRLGCSDFMAGTVGVAIDRMSRRYSRVTFEVVSLSGIGLQHELKTRNIEFFVAVLEEPFDKEDYDTEILYDDPIVVVADAHHPLVRRRSLQLADLVNEAWALPPADSASGKYIRDAFRTNGLPLPATIVSTYSHVLRHHLVATARYITILPKATIEVLAKGLSIKALPVGLPATQRTVAIVALKKRTLSPIAQLFIETLRAVAKPQTKTRKNVSRCAAA
jgi:DNA-binding transcriptional LysR family regulator